MTDFLIRPFAANDTCDVATLWREVFPNDPHWNVPEEDIARKLGFQPAGFLVALHEERVVGTAMGGFDGHRGWVYLVAVTAHQRRRGIGAALMAGVERILLDLGCTKINLQIRPGNEALTEFYRKLNFQIEERVNMGKRL